MKIIIIYYLLFYFAIVIHELGHFIAGIIIKLKSNNCYIGEELFRIKIVNFNISWLAFSGYNECNLSEISQKKIIEIIIYYFSGSFGNIIYIIFSLFFLKNYFSMILILNLLTIFLSLFPFFLKNDLNEMKKIIKASKKIK